MTRSNRFLLYCVEGANIAIAINFQKSVSLKWNFFFVFIILISLDGANKSFHLNKNLKMFKQLNPHSHNMRRKLNARLLESCICM